MKLTVKNPVTPKFRKGDLVRIRSAEEILSTLDPGGTVDGLPFMPEMLQFAGREFRVRASAHKTCDGAAEIREMQDTVHLRDSDAMVALTMVAKPAARSFGAKSG